jgi:hypothetical protein
MATFLMYFVSDIVVLIWCTEAQDQSVATRQGVEILVPSSFLETCFMKFLWAKLTEDMYPPPPALRISDKTFLLKLHNSFYIHDAQRTSRLNPISVSVSESPLTLRRILTTLVHFRVYSRDYR